MRVLFALGSLLLAAAATAQGDRAPSTGHFDLHEDLVPPLLDRGQAPSVLFQKLNPEATRRVESGHVHTFPEERWREDGELRFRVQSIGVLDAPLDHVVFVFKNLSAYKSWVPLSPSYKEVRRVGKHRLVVGLGKSDSDEVRSEAVYHVQTGGDPEILWSARWLFERKVRAFQPGSFLHYALQAHPDDPRRTLVVHTQETRITGFLAKRYLSGKAGGGGTRHRKDASKHARRIHWAVAVALEGLEGDEARASYARHYRREFGHFPPGGGAKD